MKTLLVTALTTALLSFNSFADTTTDIKDMAATMAKEGLQKMNVQFNNNLQGDIKNSLNFVAMKINTDTPVLLAKNMHKNSVQNKAPIQTADE